MDGMFETFHGGVELDDAKAAEKAHYIDIIRDFIGEGNGHSSAWENNTHVLQTRSYRTGSTWEVRSRLNGSRLVPVSAKRIMGRGPNRSKSLIRAYKMLGDSYRLPDFKKVTGQAYLDLCSTQLPVLRAHPSNHAHLAGAAGLVLREMLRHLGPGNGAFVTHLLDAVPLGQVINHGRDPLGYRQQHLRDMAAALDGYVFLAVGFDEVVVRTYNPTNKCKKSTQYIDDHIAASKSYQDIPTNRWTRWWIPHLHEIVVAIDPGGHVVSFNRLKAILSGLRGHRHSLQIQPLIAARAGDAKSGAAGSSILDYSNKRLGKLCDSFFRHLMDWHARAPNSGIYDVLVDATGGKPLSAKLHDIMAVRDEMLRITKTELLHRPGIAAIDAHINWFERCAQIRDKL